MGPAPENLLLRRIRGLESGNDAHKNAVLYAFSVLTFKSLVHSRPQE